MAGSARGDAYETKAPRRDWVTLGKDRGKQKEVKMSNFHSTVNRRDFMKGLGLAGAGLGAAAATTPVFHDLDEVVANAAGDFKHPWWVKPREFNDPTMEIDINMYVPWDQRHKYVPPYDETNRNSVAEQMDRYGYSGFPTAGKTMNELKAMWPEFENEHIKQGVKGMALRDLAIKIASTVPYERPSYLGTDALVQKSLKTPAERGVPRWEGTPEENLRMLRVAGRFACANYSLAAVEMNDFNRHFIWGNIGSGSYKTNYLPSKPVSWGPEAIDTAERRVIPESCRYALPMVNRHAEQSMKAAPGAIGGASPQWAYFFGNPQYGRMMKFLRAIGYQGYYNNMTGAQAYPVLAGLGEKGRPGNLLIPHRGALTRKMDSVFTDIPLALDPPIDAGMTKFCEACKKCATTCPTGAVSMETEPFWEIKGPFNAAGIKNWHFDYPTCGKFKSGSVAPSYCGLCLATCPFSKFSSSNIHAMVQGVVANVSIFSGFFMNMDNVFGYGKNLGGHLGHTEDDYVEEFWNTLGPETGLLTWNGNTPPH